MRLRSMELLGSTLFGRDVGMVKAAVAVQELLNVILTVRRGHQEADSCSLFLGLHHKLTLSLRGSLDAFGTAWQSVLFHLLDTLGTGDLAPSAGYFS